MVVPAGSVTTPALTASSAEPMAADMVCEPASMPPAAPGGRPKHVRAEDDQARPTTQLTTARSVNFKPSPPRLLTKDGPTRSPTPYMNR